RCSGQEQVKTQTQKGHREHRKHGEVLSDSVASVVKTHIARATALQMNKNHEDAPEANPLTQVELPVSIAHRNMRGPSALPRFEPYSFVIYFLETSHA